MEFMFIVVCIMVVLCSVLRVMLLWMLVKWLLIWCIYSRCMLNLVCECEVLMW